MNFIIPKPGTKLGEVARLTGVNNVRILNAIASPYVGITVKQSQQEPKDEPIGVSSLGTPIFTDLTLLGCTYTDNLTGRTVTLPNDRSRTGGVGNSTANEQGEGFYMNLETVIIVINQAVKVVRTEIQGRDGSVKEYIGRDDAQILINGVITGKNGVYPREEARRLKAWLDAPVAKGITAWWLDNLGISNVVVTDYSIPQIAGAYSQQVFQITAISDAPVELQISDPI